MTFPNREILQTSMYLKFKIMWSWKWCCKYQYVAYDVGCY